MKSFRKFTLLAVALMTVLAVTSFAMPARAQKTVVTWFVGLGTGTDAAQIEAQNKVVEAFNKSQDKIELKINIAASNQVAPDVLSTLIASGEAPDIVGPVGFGGSNSFSGQWLDLMPLVEKAGYDLKSLPEGLVKLYESPEGLLGIPFAVFPALMYYNVELFEEAGLAMPPTKFDEKYMLDGKEVDWDWNTVAEIAKLLTVDANGEDATSDKFDPTKIEQFGFVHQWGTLRADLSTFGGAEFYDAATGKVSIPEHWRAAAQWIHDGTWKYHFMPTATYSGSDLLKPSEFASGKVAMARVQLWYTCCLDDLKAKWDLAPVPSYKGNYYAPVDADTFRIMKATKNPEAAFTVLQYLLGEGALSLLTRYGAYPARADIQQPYIDLQSKRYPSVKNWAIVPVSLNYAAVPNHESDYPNFNKGQQRFAEFRTLMGGETGKDIDVNAEIDKLVADLQAIIDEVKK